MKLTQVERLTLINQYSILALLDPAERKYYEWLIQGLRLGIESIDRELFDQLDSKGIDRDASEFVIDVMCMYRALQNSLDDLKDKQGITPTEVWFPGFCGNTEGRYLAFASWFCSDRSGGLRRFERLYRDDMNSHCPVADTYQSMLVRWRECSDRERMSAEEIRRVLGK